MKVEAEGRQGHKTVEREGEGEQELGFGLLGFLPCYSSVSPSTSASKRMYT